MEEGDNVPKPEGGEGNPIKAENPPAPEIVEKKDLIPQPRDLSYFSG